MQPEPVYDLAHLGHLEVLTPKPDESEKFFVDVMGMRRMNAASPSVVNSFSESASRAFARIRLPGDAQA
jgi:hypothetical protein